MPFGRNHVETRESVFEIIKILGFGGFRDVLTFVILPCLIRNHVAHSSEILKYRYLSVFLLAIWKKP